MQEPRGKLDDAILGGAVLLGLLLVCLASAGVYYLARGRLAPDEVVDREPSPDASVVPPDLPLLGPGTPVDLSAAVDAMRPRYVPGPYVEVEGLLPQGLASLRRIASDDRSGGTIANPFIVPGAELRSGDLPEGPSEGAPSVALAGPDPGPGPLYLVPGAPSDLTVAATDGAGPQGVVDGLLIAFEGYEGHFYLPSVVETELGRIRVAGMDEVSFHFGIDAPVLPDGSPVPDGKPLELNIEVSAVDARGRVSAPVRRLLRVMPLGTGDLEVTLSMSRPTDLDLYVIGPTGEMLAYSNPIAFGGELDLDANAACRQNLGVDTEHVFFRSGGAPAGSYAVRVANYQSCIDGEAVDYRVTVRNCGETVVLGGRFEGEGDTTTCKGNPGARVEWCQQVVRFEVAPCRAL